MRGATITFQLLLIASMFAVICYNIFTDTLRFRNIFTQEEEDTDNEITDTYSEDTNTYYNYEYTEYVPDTLIMNIIAAGGKGTKELYSRGVNLWGWALHRPSSADIVLSLNVPEPEDCWAFSGSTGELHFYLPYLQPVRNFSLEHASPDKSNSAPRRFILYGVQANNSKTVLIESEYIQNGPAIQYYPVTSNNEFKELIFVVLSNYDNPKYTCIYRIHFYGDVNEIERNLYGLLSSI